MLIKIIMVSLLALSVGEGESRVTAEAVTTQVVVGLAKHTYCLAFISLEVKTIVAFNALIKRVISVAVRHLVLAIHLRNLACSVEQGVSGVASQTALGVSAEVCALRVDTNAHTLRKITALSTNCAGTI
jgi:hypothetical protein